MAAICRFACKTAASRAYELSLGLPISYEVGQDDIAHVPWKKGNGKDHKIHGCNCSSLVSKLDKTEFQLLSRSEGCDGLSPSARASSMSRTAPSSCLWRGGNPSPALLRVFVTLSSTARCFVYCCEPRPTIVRTITAHRARVFVLGPVESTQSSSILILTPDPDSSGGALGPSIQSCIASHLDHSCSAPWISFSSTRWRGLRNGTNWPSGMS